MFTKNNSEEEKVHEEVSTLEQLDPDDEPEYDLYGLKADADSDDDPYMGPIFCEKGLNLVSFYCKCGRVKKFERSVGREVEGRTDPEPLI